MRQAGYEGTFSFYEAEYMPRSEQGTCSIFSNRPKLGMSPMKSIVSATALVFALIWPAVHSTAALAQAQPAPATASVNPWGPPNPQIDIAYIKPKARVY